MKTHVTTNVDIRRAIRRGLRLPVPFVNDNLLLGPCAPDPEVHREQRCDFWELRGRERTQFRSSYGALVSALKSDQRIVIWTSGLWMDTLMLWALCAWRLRFQAEHPDIDVVVLGDAPPDGFSQGFVHVKPADARLGLNGARPQSLTRVQDMARRWHQVSGQAPVLSAKRVRKDLVELGIHQAEFFPRLNGDMLTLSRFDDLLFSCLGKGWVTPVDVVMYPSSAGKELREKWMISIGDYFFAMRLRWWAEHRRPEAALESVPHREQRCMLEARYRLSKAGDAIKRGGLAEIAQAPPMPIWGATAYDPNNPWVVVDEHAGRPRLERFEARPHHDG